MNWLLHDSFKLEEKAKKQAQTIAKVGLAKGIKIKKVKGKFELYILPLENKNAK